MLLIMTGDYLCFSDERAPYFFKAGYINMSAAADLAAANLVVEDLRRLNRVYNANITVPDPANPDCIQQAHWRYEVYRRRSRRRWKAYFENNLVLVKQRSPCSRYSAPS